MDTFRISWSDTLSIGNAELDAQHQELIALVAGVPDQATERDGAVLDKVLRHAAQHFIDEEAFMAQIGYPELQAHRTVHQTLTHILFAYKCEYESGQHDYYSFKHFVFRWVRDHILEDDRRLGDFVRRKLSEADAQRHPGSPAGGRAESAPRPSE